GDRGSEVRYGNMLFVPIDNAVLYVQPFYVVAEAQTRQLPRLQRVIAEHEEAVVIENTLSEALTELFGERAVTQERPDEDAADEIDEDELEAELDDAADEADDPDGDDPPPTADGATAGSLLDEAMDLFAEADA